MGCLRTAGGKPPHGRSAAVERFRPIFVRMYITAYMQACAAMYILTPAVLNENKKTSATSLSGFFSCAARRMLQESADAVQLNGQNNDGQMFCKKIEMNTPLLGWVGFQMVVRHLLRGICSGCVAEPNAVTVCQAL